jgi:hypothetical protein
MTLMALVLVGVAALTFGLVEDIRAGRKARREAPPVRD